MTKLLEKAIERARKLPDDEQDAVAITMLSATERRWIDTPMDEETRAAITEGLAQARRGEFVTDDEIKALRRRFGV